MKEEMLQDRWNWIAERQAINEGKIPDFEDFYQNEDLAVPPTPEEEEKMKAEEEEAARKKKSDKSSKGKGKGDKKKKKQEEAPKEATLQIGTADTEQINRFNEQLQEYKNK